MKCKKSLVATLVCACLCVPAMAADNGFNKRLYLGIGGGVSDVSPEVMPGVDLTVDDETSSGGKVFIGWDFSPHMAVEFGYADLGEAEIGPNNAGEIEYEVYDLSLVYHFFNLGGYDRLLARQGFGAFWKAGIGTMDNSSNLRFTRDNDVHAMAGLGVEYGTRSGIALRAEVEAFDEDAALASLSLLWRLGGGDDKSDGLFTGEQAPGFASKFDDDDADGVPNNLDDCVDTLPGNPVTATGCDMFGGVLDGVLFTTGSDKLTDDAQVVLNDAADALLNNPAVNVEVQAHTDSQGAADYNLDLSKKRALSTVRFLMLRGVPAEQLQARAFGESKPMESNDTAEGRELNRRVEFHVISP